MKHLAVYIAILWSLLGASVAMADDPLFEVTVYDPAKVAPGELFINYRNRLDTSQDGILIITNDGHRQYYKNIPGGLGLDFRPQPGGGYSYFDDVAKQYAVLDSSLAQIDTIAAGSDIDLHELLFLPSGNVLLFLYRPVSPTVSLTQTILSTVIQELDPANNVVWEWDSWGHIPLTYTWQPLTAPVVDYVHGNAIEVDYDGHLLMSARHTDSVVKINRQTGQIIWTLGGVGNEFTFTNDAGFNWQHDIRRLPNGHITLFDNGTATRNESRAVEYEIDEAAKVITRTWEYKNAGGLHSLCCGSARRLDNGNTLIGWGWGHPSVTEVTSAGEVVFELDLQPLDAFSYRAYKGDFLDNAMWFPRLFE